MAEESDRLMTCDDEQRFNKTLGALSGEPGDARILAPHSGGKNTGEARPSQHEERTWLIQQQDPHTVLRRALAYRLGGWLDIPKLVHAVRTLIRSVPDLNARYSFDDDGELRKLHADGEGQYLEILSADSRHQAVDIILARQAASWDPEHEPPFKALLILERCEVVLALLMHRILDETCRPEDLLRMIAQVYNDEPPASTATLRSTVPTAGTSDPAPVAWIRRADTRSRVEIVDFGAPDAVSSARRQAALRYGTTIEGQALSDLAGSPPDTVRLLAAISVQFARFLCMLGGHSRITLVLPRRPEVQLGDLGADPATADLLQLILERDLPVADAVERVLSHLHMPRADNSDGAPPSPADDLPQARIAWLTDPRRFFAPRSVIVERLPIPTLEMRPDLELAVGINTEGKIVLEMMTGQAVSHHAGPFLMERFVGFINSAETLGSGRGAIPLSSAQAANRAEAPAPPTADIDAIAALILSEFREALGSPDMGPDDDFFDHGGHSLIATRIIGRLLGTHGIEVHFNDLFSYPTAASLAPHATLTGPAAGPSSGGRIDQSPAAPLSLAQMSLWKAYAAFGFNEIFNIPFALEFLAPVNEHVFECAFTDILERHPGLRTLFFKDGETVRQEVMPMYDLPRYKWFWSSRESEGVDRHQEARHHFDLASELPLRLRFLIDPATNRQILSFLFHHIVLDEWSVNLMMDELAEAYRARAAGREPAWSTTPAAFHEFARQQNERGVDKAHLAYWTDMLRDAPKGLPIFEHKEEAHDQPGDTSPAGGWVELKLERAVSEGLYALAKENSASLFNVAYAAIAASLHKLGRLSDLVIGTSASGRIDPDFFDTVGYFTTVVAHRLLFRREMTVGELIATVKNTINQSMPHTEIPIDLVEEALGMTPGRDHLFEVFIQIHAKNKLNGTLPTPDGGSIEFRQVDPDKHESLLGLHFEVMEETVSGERSIRVLMSYRADHYAPEQVERIRSMTSGLFTQFSCPGASAMTLAELAPEQEQALSSG
ncbi:condensation domain-containing protein [Phyllobacterium phragmitis]|uniref:Carrier domain-containing protein n=1 Tax=Phyllobacterium phragmitis TaxID=2670329 RepID=A0ABQ0H5Z7_9HYPH